MIAFLILIAALFVIAGPVRSDDATFERIAPLLEERCLSCHNDRDRKGGLSLATSQSALAGGDSGPAFDPGDADASYLVDLITPHDSKAEMPQGQPPLAANEIAAIRAWITAGAPWPKERTLAAPKWWSLRPLAQPSVPRVSGAAVAWVRNPIDAFISEQHAARGLSHAKEADRRMLIRRLYFDLTGLAPTPEEISEFVADSDPRAYEQLVDRLLASPRYGERWARHWLDVVHYGETHGYDKDKPRPNAWPYRDYVIRSLNDDKPYAQFAAEQIAGDVLRPGSAEGIEALGFLAAGPWDFIGHAEVPETKIDGKVARHLDRDDMVQSTITTFCSLTVGCAQCHDHKFDPIPQEDYYKLQAVFAALDRTDKPYDADPARMKLRESLLTRERDLAARREPLAAEITRLGGTELADLDRQIAAAGKPAALYPPQFGYHSGIEPRHDTAKWVQVDLANVQPIERIELAPCHDDFANIGAGFGFPVRFKVEIAADAEFTVDVHAVLDQTQADFANPKLKVLVIDAGKRRARFIRVTATRLAPRQNDYIFSLAELKVWSNGTNIALGRAVTALDSIEAPVRWGKANLVDGLQPAEATNATLAELQQRRQTLVDGRVDQKVRTRFAEIETQLAAVRAELAALPATQMVYAGSVHHGSGNFRGTGPDAGRPRRIHVLPRGDVTRPGHEVGPGALSLLAELPGEFKLSPEAAESERRAALARWLTARENPFTWRSIVNRVWLYHVGRGLVDTPDDFGRMGERPTHAALLDWLAVEFRDHCKSVAAPSGGSLKALHRLIVTSATYRQASSGDSRFAAVDSGNAYYWRMNARRLEAEAIRDALLNAAGKLNLTMGGPSFQDFIIEKPEHSPHYQYHLHDPDDPRSQRRSVYRFVVRSKMHPFLTVMDCADPSISVAKRNETVSPLQALALLNNDIALVMAKHFAARVERETQGAQPATVDMQVARAFELALGRVPRPEELAPLAAHASAHGLPSACRLLFNLNEFVFID